MADLVTRLLLYTNNFDNNLEKSSRRLANFKRTGMNAGSALSKLGGTVVKFAGALGVATTAGEALKTMFTHNDQLADMYQRTMKQAETVTTSFFSSLANGNLGSFFQNLGAITETAREAYNALDALNTYKTGTSIEMSNLRTEYQLQLNLAKDRTLAEKERLEHLEKARVLMRKQTEQLLIQLRLTQATYKATFNNLMNSYGGFGSLKDNEDDRFIFEHWGTMGSSVQSFVDTYKEGLQKLTSRYLKVRETYTDSMGFEHERPTAASMAAKREIDAYVEKHGGRYQRYNAILNMFNTPDDQVKEAINLAKEINDIQVALSNTELELNRTETRITGVGSGGRGSKASAPKKTVYAEGTEGWYDQQIQAAQAKLKNASVEMRVELERQIAQWNHEKKALEFNTRIVGWKAVEKEMESRGIAMPDKTLPVTKSPKIDVYVEAQMKQDLMDKFAELKANPVPTNLGMGSEEKMQLTVDAINAAASALSALNEEFDKSVAGIMKWVSTLLSASAQAVKAIIAVTAAKSAQSAAETPVVGWLLAAGAAASVMAALSALCTFAQGGIVPGSNYSGDHVLARVNSGEMILNRGQQANLFNLLDRGAAGGSGGGRVEFVIQGDKLRGILDNHDNRVRKIS